MVGTKGLRESPYEEEGPGPESDRALEMVELIGIEPTTSRVRF